MTGTKCSQVDPFICSSQFLIIMDRTKAWRAVIGLLTNSQCVTPYRYLYLSLKSIVLPLPTALLASSLLASLAIMTAPPWKSIGLTVSNSLKHKMTASIWVSFKSPQIIRLPVWGFSTGVGVKKCEIWPRFPTTLDDTRVWAALLSKRSKISEIKLHLVTVRWLLYVLIKFGEVQCTPLWASSPRYLVPLKKRG